MSPRILSLVRNFSIPLLLFIMSKEFFSHRGKIDLIWDKKGVGDKNVNFLIVKKNVSIFLIPQTPDIGAELTGGCYGFATRYMHWPEQLIVGGTTKNKTGHITR